ncbi:MAG: hypothetical protein QMD77_01185 [Patescibacteria group bacterium]|nr:hypothetical protein [Patescibacteria group bacterium]
MKAKRILFLSLIFVFGLAANFVFAANGADCTARGGWCDKACLTKPNIGGYDCPAGWQCCGDPSTAQQKIFGEGGLDPFSSSAQNTQTSIFGNPLGQNMGTIDQVLASTSGYLNAVAGTIGVIFILIGAVMYMISAGNKEMAERGKKIVFASIAGVAVVVAAPVFWKEITTIIGGNPSNIAGTSSMARIVMNVLKLLLSIVGSLAVISLLIGGIMMFSAAGDDKRIETAKKILTYSIIGIIISFGALVISQQIIQLLGGYLGYGGNNPGGYDASGISGNNNFNPLQVNTNLIRFDKPGQTEQLKISFFNPATGQSEDVTGTAKYTSSNQSVASVSSAGLVTNTFAGSTSENQAKATISVQYQGASVAVQVEVLDRSACAAIDSNDTSPSAGKVAIVFINKGFTDKEKFKKRIEERSRFNADPVNKDNFSLWRSDVPDKDVCSIAGAFVVYVHGEAGRDYAEGKDIHLFELRDDEKWAEDPATGVKDIYTKILTHEIGHAVVIYLMNMRKTVTKFLTRGLWWSKAGVLEIVFLFKTAKVQRTNFRNLAIISKVSRQISTAGPARKKYLRGAIIF